RRPTSVTASRSLKSTTSATSATARPGASGLRSTATTRAPTSRARSIARRWWRPAPTKSIVPSTGAMLLRRLDPDREEERHAVPTLHAAGGVPLEPVPDGAAAVDAADACHLQAGVHGEAGLGGGG